MISREKYLDKEEAKKKALGQGNPDIGPSSSFDTIQLDKSEKGLKKRRQPMRTGKKGRPRLTKHLEEEHRHQL